VVGVEEPPPVAARVLAALAVAAEDLTGQARAVGWIGLAGGQRFGDQLLLGRDGHAPCVRRQLGDTLGADPHEAVLGLDGGLPALGTVSLVDLQRGHTEQIDAPDLTETWGVDFNSVGADRGLLAVHGRSRLGVYRLVDRRLELVASRGITPPESSIGRQAAAGKLDSPRLRGAAMGRG
jgi:hypothetical protein